MTAASTTRFGRRGFLRGLGVLVSLPTLESLAFAKDAASAAETKQLATTASGMPLRAGFIGFANGSNYERWLPYGSGRNYELNETFEPAADVRDKFQIITNLAHDAANNWGDGPGDHARAGATLFTGCHAWKTLGARLHLGISVDQIVAKQVGHLTRVDSLQLGVEGARLYGSCDTGYPCAYQYNLSWASETLPLAPEPNPRVVFEKLFGGGSDAAHAANLERRLKTRKSVLDFVRDDWSSMKAQLGKNDRRKVDEYLEGVRAIERQITKIEEFPAAEAPIGAPAGVPSDHTQHVDLMYDLMALAYQTDATRVISFCVAPEGSNRPFLELGISEGHHYLTHHSGDEAKILKVAKIEKWYMERFVRFLKTLDGMKDADGASVLHNSMIVYGSAIGDGNRHNHDELPVVLAGAGGGTLDPGKHLLLKEAVPMTNLFCSMLDRLGVQAEKVGDSTGRLEGV